MHKLDSFFFYLGVNFLIFTFCIRIPRREMIRLYRQIFHAHRTYLPPHLRYLGNEYVRNEWQQHKNADTKFVVKFYSVSSLFIIIIGRRDGDDERDCSIFWFEHVYRIA